MEHVHFQLLLLLIISVIFPNLTIPSQYSHLVSTPVGEEQDKYNVVDNFGVPEIYEINIVSNIRNRFANTSVCSKVRNAGESAQEATFVVVLPQEAFISRFVMVIDNTTYTADVKRKEEAQKAYNDAKSRGLAAAYIGTDIRDSNRFMVTVNIKPQAKATFCLTYEELLQRKQGSYEHVINIHPGQPVQNLNVEVNIHESRNLALVKTRPIGSGKEFSEYQLELNADATITRMPDNKKAIVKFSPNLEKQKQLSRALKTNEKYGLSGQFVVQYDVERDPSGGDVLIRDGYFVHFFAPSDLEPLPKHVVFLLDTSSSMKGTRMEQLKQAMKLILDQMHDQDLFHLVEFNTNVKVWNLNEFSESVWFPISNDDFDWDTYDEDELEISVDNFVFPSASPVNPHSRKRAKNCIDNFVATGATDIYSGFKVALHLVNTTQRMQLDNIAHQPMIIFLTDGIPNIRYTKSTEIRSMITNMNTFRASIFSLSFGDEADEYFTKWLSKQNSGFKRHIYPDLDASLQIMDFYKTISSPLLQNIKFKFSKSVQSLTIVTHPIYFDGCELMVAGFCDMDSNNFTSSVTGYTNEGRKDYIPVIKHTISNVERIWAYLYIKQLLDNKEASDEDRNRTTELALKYSFVTPVTSLVVLEPNGLLKLDTEDASKGPENGPSLLIIPSTSQPDSTISPNLKSNLLWLKDMVNENGTVNLLSGNYKIASSSGLTEVVSCPKTPTDETTGHCKLLDNCPQVYATLTDFNIFAKYSCILQNEYAGICCPNNI